MKFSTLPSLILIKLGELVDTIENSLLAKFHTVYLAVFVVQG
jgi:hypothetical protein